VALSWEMANMVGYAAEVWKGAASKRICTKFEEKRGRFGQVTVASVLAQPPGH
jgi:hypothetical protein